MNNNYERGTRFMMVFILLLLIIVGGGFGLVISDPDDEPNWFESQIEKILPIYDSS